MDQKIGGWAFMIGAILAILLGLIAGFAPGMVDATLQAWLMLVLVILGLIVGFLNVGDREIQHFLVASIALLVVGAANLTVIDFAVAPLGTALDQVIRFLVVFVAPAALIVALKSIKDLAGNQ